MPDFKMWKEEYENSSLSSFILHSAPKRHIGYQSYYYYCNRTGHYFSKGKGKRGLKIQGSSKLDAHCTAFIRAKKYDDGCVEVTMCEHHTHETQLAHLHLPQSTKEMVAAKLADGVTINSIIDSVRDNVSKGTLFRKHLLCRQDVHNICNQYNLEGVKLHGNDHTSVSLWVEALRNTGTGENPVLLFKQQGKEQPNDLDDLSKDDFVIAIQTPFQRYMLRHFGTEAVCMDSTHGTNMYDFHLISIVILDDFREGVPVCWIISNREDSAVIRQVLLKLKQSCGDIHTKVFMSDDAENFYNAWRGVFTTSCTKKLICSWHIDKSWKRGILSHISNKTKHKEVYHHLRVLLEEGDEASFRLRLQQFMSWLSSDPDLCTFLQYFQREYAKRSEQWAPCYRIATVVNTNMAIEAFHRLLKVCYMEKKQNRRVDKLLHLLLKVARDKIFERFLKTQKGKTTYRQSEINKRHKTASETMETFSCVSSTSTGSWTVKCTDSSKSHRVDQLSTEPPCCRLCCQVCKVCVHSFSCDCLDYILHATICKHIHLVQMHSESLSFEGCKTGVASNESSPPPFSSFPDSEPPDPATVSTTVHMVPDKPNLQTMSSVQYLAGICGSKITSDIQGPSQIQSVKEKALATCKQIEFALNKCDNKDAISTGIKHLNAALIVIKGIANTPHCQEQYPVQNTYAPNSNSKQQLRFKSTKRKSERQQNSTLSKPNQDEIKSYIHDLDEVDIQVCGFCLKRDDRRSCEVVEWIQCDSCQVWFHSSCVFFDCESETSFLCNICERSTEQQL